MSTHQASRSGSKYDGPTIFTGKPKALVNLYKTTKFLPDKLTYGVALGLPEQHLLDVINNEGVRGGQTLVSKKKDFALSIFTAVAQIKKYKPLTRPDYRNQHLAFIQQQLNSNHT